MWYEDDDEPESSGDELERIAYAALTSKWEHPRDLRVLVALLRHYPKGLTRYIGLRKLAIDSGLSDDGKLTRPTLDRLQDAGWLTWSHSKFDNRTTFELIVQESQGTYPLWELYNQTSDAFISEVTGSAGYLLCCFVKASGKHVFTVPELVTLTRQHQPWVEKTLFRMTTAGLAWYVDKWDLTPMYERLDGDSWFGCSVFKERQDRFYKSTSRPMRGGWS